MAQNNATDASDYITEPAEDEQGYRHDDLEVGSKVVYEGEVRTVAGISRSAIGLEPQSDGEPEESVREGGIELVVGVVDDDDKDAATDDVSEYQTLADLVGEGWVAAERNPVEPPTMEWTVGGVSLTLSPHGYSEGTPLDRKTEGSTSVTRYAVEDYIVHTDVDSHDPSGPYKLKVEQQQED